MASILFLCHRLPWPPTKGDKIRSYHVLRRLVRDHRVYLGAFIDDPADWQYVPEVERVCAGTCVRPLPSWRARLRALAALARGEPLTVGCYRDRAMRRWVREVIATQHPEAALCFSSGVAPLLHGQQSLRRVMDFVDADSDKWRQYAEARSGLARVVYAREARTLAAFEHSVATAFDASLFVSDAEAAFFRKQVPAAAAKVHGVSNGVDCDFWDPRREYPDPYPAGSRVVAFTGAMDYRANIDAVAWFAGAVWPQIAAQQPDARFFIVGSHPADAVRALAERPGITVTGAVPDVRPYLAHAHVVAAPLRIARGIQNKVLEALAMAKPVLATPQAWEGIDDFAGRAGCVSAAPDALAAEAVRWLDAPRPASAPTGRVMVQARFDWERNLDRYTAILAGNANARAAARAVQSPRMEACA